MQEGKLAIRRDQQQPVRLPLLAGDLAQELRPRDADGDRQTDLLSNRNSMNR
jgi:hypothetical protein